MAKLGLHTFAFATEWQPAQAAVQLPRLRELGVELIEIPLLRPDEIDIDASRQVAEAQQIELTCSLGLPDRFDIERDQDDIITFLEGALDVTAKLGSRLLSGVTYGSIGKTSGAPPTQSERDAVCRIIERAGKAAAAHGLMLGVEPCNRYETHLMNTAADARALIERSGADNVRIHLDTYHMNIEEAGMTAGFGAAGSLLGYVHLSESHRGVPGTGTVDWRDCMQGLASCGFDGPAVLESFNFMHPDIASGLAVWKPVAPKQSDVTEKGLPYLRQQAATAGFKL